MTDAEWKHPGYAHGKCVKCHGDEPQGYPRPSSPQYGVGGDGEPVLMGGSPHVSFPCRCRPPEPERQPFTAYDELMAMLGDGETVEGIVFGDWEGLGDAPITIPACRRGVVLSLDLARPYLKGFKVGYGGRYVMYAWTAKQAIFVKSGAGYTALVSAPRHPCPCEPIEFGE